MPVSTLRRRFDSAETEILVRRRQEIAEAGLAEDRWPLAVVEVGMMLAHRPEIDDTDEAWMAYLDDLEACLVRVARHWLPRPRVL